MSKLNASCPFVAVLTISGGKITTTDEVISTFVRGPVVWAVVNNDDKEYWVRIVYGNIKHKKSGVRRHPFPHTKNNQANLPAAVSGGTTWAAMVDVIKDYTLPSGTTHDTYKYNVELSDAADKPIMTLDPDVDVVDPFPIVIEDH